MLSAEPALLVASIFVDGASAGSFALWAGSDRVKVAPFPSPAVLRRHERPAVELGELSRKREPDAETVIRHRCRRAFEFGEHFEQTRELLGGNADTLVDDADDGHISDAPELDAHLCAGGRVLRRVVEKVADDLGDPGRVGEGRDVGLDVHADLLLASREERVRSLDRALDQGRQGDVLLAQLERAAADARHVEEVIDEADHVIELPVHRGDRAAGGRGLVGLAQQRWS